jgi:hypothetical protein
MALTFTSNTLINSIKIRAQIPTNQVTFRTEDFLQLSNEELVIGVVPSILQLHEDYYLHEDSIPLQDNKSNYPIPYRAIGNKLRDVKYKDDAGNIYEMVRIDIERITDFNNTVIQSSTGLLYYYVQNNEIILWPNIQATGIGSLLMSYYLRPNQLVKEDRAGLITNIDTNTGVITVEDFPDNFSSSIQYDFIMTRTPHKIMSFDITPTGASSVLSTVTFNPDDIPEDLVVGDYLMQAEETIIPQLPTELHAVLAQRVACRCLEALGDTQGLSNANTKLQEMEFKTGNLIDNRVEGSPQKVVNRTGFLRRSNTYRRF